MKVVFFGTDHFIASVLDVLNKSFEVPVSFSSPNQTIKPEDLRKFNSDLFVVASYGKILSKEILEIPKFGAINLHPSLLPKYRGPSPIQTAILNGDKKTGITIIKMDERVDHGPILFQTEKEIRSDDTFLSLAEKLFQTGADYLYQTINQYVKGDLKSEPQDDSETTFTKLLTKKDGEIDLLSPPEKEKLERMIRAFYPWPGVWFKWKTENGKWKILKLLPNDRIQVEGKKPMSYKDFINGYAEGEKILRSLRLI